MKQHLYPYMVLATALAVCFSCAREPLSATQETPMSITVETRLQGSSPSINTDADKEDQVTKVRMVSRGATQLENISGATNVTFPVKYFTGQQNFFFIANEKENLSAITPETFNQKEFNTIDYISPPFLMTAVLKNVYVQTVGENTQLNASTVQLERVFARLKYTIDVTGVTGLSVKSIKIINIPSRFTLGGMITQYPRNSGHAYIQRELLAAPVNLANNYSGYVYLPEHNPANEANRTKMEMTFIDNNNPGNDMGPYSFEIKEPYSSVNDGKIVRNGNYVITIKLQSFFNQGGVG